jgi:hypothetical protein
MSDGKIGGPRGVFGTTPTGAPDGVSPHGELARRYDAFRDKPVLVVDGQPYFDTKGPDVAGIAVRMRGGVAVGPAHGPGWTATAAALMDALGGRMGKVPFDAVTVAGYGPLGQAVATEAKARGLAVTILPAPGEDPVHAALDGWRVDTSARKPQGPVVDSTGSLKKLEAMFPDADIVGPDDARPATRASGTADALLDALTRRMGRVPFDAVTVAGFGAIGQAVAQAAKDRGLAVTVLATPGSDDKARAQADGWQATDDPNVLKKGGPVVDATGGSLKKLEAMFPDADIVGPSDV